MKTIAKTGLTVLGLVVVLGGVFLARFMSLGIPRQDWSPGALDLSAVTDGTYQGRYRVVPPFGAFAAFRDVRVEVEVSGHAIHRIGVLSPVPLQQSLAELGARVVSRQGLDVDAVSGGTWSSRAYLKAVEAAVLGGTR